MLKKAKYFLKKYYGYDEFRPGQERVIGSILKRKDLIAIMPTGSGKSICYQIPALLFPGLSIVISPLISLMKDQVDVLEKMGIPATFLNSSVKAGELKRRISMIKKGEYKLLYIAPERLESPGFFNFLNTLDLSMLAIDEAHCISQWGHDFRPGYLYIGKIFQQLKIRPIVSAFTATATPDVRKDIIKQLNLIKPEIYLGGFDRENLTFIVKKGINKDKFLLEYLKEHLNRSGIVYAATRKEVDRLNRLLLRKGYSVGRYHAGLSDEERYLTQDSFLNDDLNIVIATNAFGMGIDKSNLSFVIHYNMPGNIESYYQEAGRAGRDGEPADCILLYSPEDKKIQNFFIEQSGASPERKDQQLARLQAMVGYCYTGKCLRAYILSYLGDETTIENCANCSNCIPSWEIKDLLGVGRLFLSSANRFGKRY